MAVTESKKAIVAQMKETLSEAKGAVLIGYSGLTVAQATELRRKMLAEGVEYKVIKNTLTRIAANELNLEGFSEHLEGPTALATSKEDAVAPARVIEQFIKTTDKEVVTVKAGIVEAVSYTHLRAHETLRHLVCRLLLEKKKQFYVK